MPRIARIARSVEQFNSFLGRLSYVLIALQAGFVVVAIFMRYVLNDPFKAATEIGQITMVFVSLLGCSYVLKMGGHIHVEVLIGRLKPRARDLITGVNYLLFGVPYCGVLFYYCFLSVQSSYSINEHTQGAFILLWPIKSIFILGFTMLGLQFLISGIRRVHRAVTGRSSVEGVKNG